MDSHPLSQWRIDAQKAWNWPLAQEIARNHTVYDERLVLPYTLPDPLKCFDGQRVQTAHDWFAKRRPELLKWFTEHLYGPLPPRAEQTTYELLEESDTALDGTAIRRQIRMNFAMANGRTHCAELLVYLPKNHPRAIPAFLGLNFQGNHSTIKEDAVHVNPQTANIPRGEPTQMERWQHRLVVSRGYASVTACYHDFFPDHPDGWTKSVWNLFEDCQGHCGPHPHHGSISAWAWGLSRILDCLETCPEIDATRVVLHGHSRLGKTALWAGANDQRFRMVIANDSGCCGAALSRRWFGETLMWMLNVVPYWCPTTAREFILREPEMPVDQHELLALIAPRPLVVASATEDLWADPRGEFLAAHHAGPVFELLGHHDVLDHTMPTPDTNLSGDVSYHIRTGKHGQTRFDWLHYLQLADCRV